MDGSIANAYLTIVPEMDSKAVATIKSGVVSAGKTAAAAAAVAIGAAFAATMKSSLDNYANYEQLVGGAQLMFGDAYDFVADKAKNAYSTVQMSQNDYLTQVNGFATGLKTSLGGNAQAAAELADKIVTAQADIVAATGNSQEAVQNAFNGIMRNNYTMLDNLQLGITPTKAGMQEVIDKVNEWNAAQGNLTSYTIDSLADQEAALVDYVKMVGMAGYAQEEASGTIQGSLASAKAAYSNWLTGLADDNADIEDLTNKLVDSVVKSASNIAPRLFQIASTLIDNIPDVLKKFGQTLYDNAPILQAKLSELIESLVSWMLDPNTLYMFLEVGLRIIAGIAEGLMQGILNLIGRIPEMFGQWLDGVKEYFGIASPSKLMRDIVGKNLMLGWAEGINENAPIAVKAMDDAMGLMSSEAELAFNVSGGRAQSDSLLKEVKTLRENLGDTIYYNTPQYTQRQFARAVKASA